MSINYCNCGGLMATCDKADDPMMQHFCEFAVPASKLNKSKSRYCTHLRKGFNNHCDSAHAQWSAKHGSKEMVIPLTEEEVFDITNKDTYPEYKKESGDMYL